MGKWFGNTTWKQRTNVRKIHRALGILLAMALVFQMVPFASTAVSASENSGGGLCTHHRSHTPDCGYKEAEPGHGCTHEHTEDCYRIVEDCIHEHAESCYPADNASESEATPADAEEKQPTECSHSCSGDSGCITKEPDCQHEHDDSCGYRVGTPGTPCTFICEICNGGISEDDGKENNSEAETPGTETGDETKEPDGEPAGKTDNGQEKCICEEPCEESSGNEGGRVNKECPVCGAENADLSDCKGKAEKEDTKQPEDTGICKHHQEHDDACGYQPESEDSEGSPCTYECRICPIEDLIAALPDKVTEDNAEDVRGQLDEILALFSVLTEDEQEQIDLSRCYELQGALDGANDPDPITESVEYQEASWDGSQVTYESKTETCTLVENSAEAVTWTAGWYAVSGTVTIDQPITVTGAVNLILTDGCDLTAAKGIVVTDGNSLTIYAQSENGGTLNATGMTDDSGNASAGIGGGSGGGTSNNITIYGGSVTASSTGTGTGGAGIGGGGGLMGGGAGNNIQIYGGTINATGSECSAGIGGGGSSTIDDSSYKSGDGAVTISGGTVTAVGGKYAAGIGGGGGYYRSGQYGSSGCIGGTGSVTISGGIVDASSPTDVYWTGYAGAPIGNGGNTTATATVNKTTGIVFENGAGTVCGNVTFDGSYPVPADYTLNIPAGASLSGSGTLTGGGTFTADLSEDMVSVPTDLYYNGQDRSNDIKTRLSDGLTQGIVICGQTFTVSGWTVEVSRTDDLHYTATYTNTDNSTTFQKTITLQQSGTTLDGAVKTYNGDTQTTTFTASDTITVKATPTATGQAPAKAAARLRDDPTAGQMVVFVGDTQVCAPADVGANGSYTMNVSAADVLVAAGGPGTGITLTAKFVGNDNMADGAGTVDVSISAVAKIENGSTTTYVGNLDDAFKTENDGATITLLKDVTRTPVLDIQITCNLDLGGHTITCTYGTAISIWSNANLTIQGAGEVISTNKQAIVVAGNVTLEGGTFTSKQLYSEGVYINSANASLSVVNENVTIRNTGGGCGLAVNNAQSVQLSGGTYSGTAGAISIVGGSLTLGNLLGHSSDTRYAYFDESGTTPFTGVLGNKSLTGTVTVKKCNHTGEGVCEYTHATSTTTHQQTCLACGKKWDEENCSYADSRCACGSTLSVALAGTERLIYDGNPREPGVTVTLDGTKLAETDYGVTYANNINAGTDTATVTVKGKENYSFEIKKTFSIEKAEQKDFAATAVTTQYEKNGTFILSTTGGSGDGAVLYRVPENNGVLMVNGDQATIIGVGTVAVTATKAESDNYKAATATGKITIEKAPAPAITYPTAGSIAYGQKLSDSALTGGSTEYGTFAWENGSMVPAVDNTGYTVVFTASGETKKNYETITDTTQKVSVKVEKAVPAVSITAAVSGSKDDRQSAITVNVAKAGAGAFPTGTVTFIDCTGSTEVEIGAATLSNGTASYTWDGLLDKTYTIKAVYAGDSNYKEAVSREFTFDAAKQNQQDFALDAIGAKIYGDAAVTLKTTGGNGSGAVRYESSDEDVIRIEDGRAVIVGAGTATITAIKEGDDKYNEASASRNVTVAKKALTVRADSKTVARGNPMPAFTYRADGLVNGDTFTTAPSITANVQNTDTLGKYDIAINGGTLRNSESYHITYVNGTLKIVECFYTVTVTDGTGGGEYAEGDTVTVTANDRSGYTFTGWSSEDGVGFADSKAKTTTFTMPAKSVTVKANYTRNSSGGNNGGGSGDGGNSGGSGNNGGGNSGDNENNGGQGSGGGDSTNPGNGSNTPQIPVIPPADNTNPGNEATPGTGTTPVNPGTENTVRPGTTPGSGSAGTPAQGTKQPFIKGADGKIGWEVIRAEEENAEEGSVINVDMNGSTVVPGDIFDSIKGKDITITFDMGSGILWSVDGKNITTDKAGDIDFSVKTGVKTVPVDIINNVTGENYSIQISLAYEGEFGFTAVLSINLGKENAGYTASLYYYNESTGELEFICKDQIAEDGTVSLAFTHASDYVIMIGIEAMDGKEGVDDTSETPRAGDDSIIADVKENDEATWIYKLVIAVGTIVVVAGFGIIFIWKKKKEEQ